MFGVKAAGKSADEVARAWKIPAKYAGYATPTAVRPLQNVQVVFDDVIGNDSVKRFMTMVDECAQAGLERAQ